jgi:hypothetical protein
MSSSSGVDAKSAFDGPEDEFAAGLLVDLACPSPLLMASIVSATMLTASRLLPS